MTDTERLDFLAKLGGPRRSVGLMNDESGRWVVFEEGIGPPPFGNSTPRDLILKFPIWAEQWQSTIREAIDRAIRGELYDENPNCAPINPALEGS